MKTFYFTFGQKYRHEQHPAGGHPDGWFEIAVPNGRYAQELARVVMFSICDELWANWYAEEGFTPKLYPKGCLAHFDVTVQRKP